MKKFVIASKNLPTHLPINSTGLYTFLMYYFNVGQLWWGMYILFMAVWWIGAIYVIWHQEEVDLTKEDSEHQKKQSRFLQRLIEMQNEQKSKKENLKP